MATIVGGIASSHTPTIGFAVDTHKQHDAVWAPIFEGYRPVQQWLADKRPDVLLVVFNESQAVLDKDLELFEIVLARKEVLAGFRRVRSMPILERIGHRICSIALWPTIQR